MFVGSPALLFESNLSGVITSHKTLSKIKPLCVIFDSTLNFSHFSLRITQTSSFHIQAMKQVRNPSLLTTTVSLTISLVLLRSDYYNFLHCGLPVYVFFKLHLLAS